MYIQNYIYTYMCVCFSVGEYIYICIFSSRLLLSIATNTLKTQILISKYYCPIKAPRTDSRAEKTQAQDDPEISRHVSSKKVKIRNTNESKKFTNSREDTQHYRIAKLCHLSSTKQYMLCYYLTFLPNNSLRIRVKYLNLDIETGSFP